MENTDESLMFADAISRTTSSAIGLIYTLLGVLHYYPRYYKFPESTFHFLLENERYKLSVEHSPLKYGVEFYSDTIGEKPINYGDILSANEEASRVCCDQLDGFIDLKDTIKRSEKLSDYFKPDSTDYVYKLRRFLANIVNRYFYHTKKFKVSIIDQVELRNIVAQQVNRLFMKDLSIEVLVPISLAVFEQDEIRVNDIVSISRMSGQFQMSRYIASNFKSKMENMYTQCAAYTLKISNHYVNNEIIKGQSSVFSDYRIYPIQLIDDFFAALRVAGCSNIGYGQLLSSPIGWADEWITDLPAVYGTTIIAFNRKNEDFTYFGCEFQSICNKTIELAIKLFNIIIHKRETTVTKKTDPFNRVFLALYRLNRCWLREDDIDTMLDAVIGIESLLSNNNSELSFRISSRIAVVVSKMMDCPFSPHEARKAMKKIYDIRSRIAHGTGKVEVMDTISVSGKTLSYSQLAIDFLRYSLMFIILNQEYLGDDTFEKLVDDQLLKK